MKYRLKIETKHEELFDRLFELVERELVELGAPPMADHRKTKSSFTLKLTVPIKARDNLDDLKDEEGRTKLKYSMAAEFKKMRKRNRY